MHRMDHLMGQWDVLVGPPNRAALFASNFAGYPEVSVPCGFVDGAPQALRFTGKLYREGAPLRLALAFERGTDWHSRRPPVDWA